MFDEMGFLPATPYNKINIHVGGTYGDKEAALERFSKVCVCVGGGGGQPLCSADMPVLTGWDASTFSSAFTGLRWAVAAAHRLC